MMSNDYLKGNEKLRELVDFCHDNNIDEYVSFPEIAVMGDTSSGKSSLLSALAQLQLPSNDQITTRSPLRLRMEKSKKKYTNVRIKWNAASAYKDEAAWPKVTLDNWEEVAATITAAQDLILQRGQVEVAFDVVEVNVYGPDCVDLTLIDLPGIVRTVGKNESKSLIDDIKQLIDSYLCNPRCVILAVQPANVDFHNSQIMADAREVDPATRRTIPVITKPDLIDAGAEGGVTKLLLGGEVDFAMGFHMVKCRSQQALNSKMSMEEGIREEAKFFNTVAPWKDLDKELFGIVNLRTKLSKLQVRMIQESVPGIIKEIMDKRQDVTSRLEALGSLASTDRERRDLFSQIVKGVVETVVKTLRGDSAALRQDGVTFLSEEHTQFATFRDELMNTKLAKYGTIEEDDKVVVLTAGGREESGCVAEIFEKLDGTKSYAVYPDSPSTSSLYGPEVQLGFSADHVVNEHTVYPAHKHYLITRTGNVFGTSGLQCTGRLLSHVAACDIAPDTTWLKKRIKSNRTNDLPCFLSASVFNSIVAESVADDWTPLCLQLLEDRKAAHLDLVQRAVAGANISDRYPALHRMLLQRAEGAVQDSFQEAENEVSLSMENVPYTQNHYLFETITKMRNKRLRNKILNMVKGKSEGVESVVSAAFTDVEKMSIEDHIAEEMQIILNAYGKVAAKRVIDNVPMIIQQRSRALQSSLDKVLQVTDEELASLMVEDELTVRRVKQYTEKKYALDLAVKKLQELHLF